MRTIETNLYSFSELSEEAKQNAIEWFRTTEDFSWIYNEVNATLEKFCDIFSIRIREFDPCEMYRSEWSHGIDEGTLVLRGQRLATYIHNNFYMQISKGKYYGRLVDTFKDGSKIPVSKEYPIGQRHVKRYSKINREMDNCPLTGMGYDCSVLDPIIKFLKRPDERISFEDLLNDCLHSLAKDVEKEIEYRNTDEAIIEGIEANEYEFTENGKLS